MALFTSYLKPGVYTAVIYSDAGISLFGSARIPVLIGEGLEYSTVENKELHRGSSNVADEQEVLEDLSASIDGHTRSFSTTYSPVVKGDGTGTGQGGWAVTLQADDETAHGLAGVLCPRSLLVKGRSLGRLNWL